MDRVARSIEELFPLIEYCKAGNLRAVSDWIAAGHPLNPPPGKKTKRRTPLQVAIEKGFLTLTETLLEAGADPLANGNALHSAINHKRADMVSLLIDRGIPIDSNLFVWACYSGDPSVIQAFLDRGADPIKEFPFYHAFTASLRPVLGVYKSHVERVPELRTQANMALCHFAKEGNLKWVSLLLWVGAQPDVEVPNFKEPKSEFLESCALVQAAQAGHVSVLKRMKPENYPHLHCDLLEACWLRNSHEVLDYLKKLNLPPEADPAKASKSLEHLLSQLRWDTDPDRTFGSRDPAEAERTINRIEYLVSKGAKWIPGQDRGLRDARQYFRKLGPEKILRIFTLFRAHQVVGDEFLESLVDSATMRAHLGPKFVKAVNELFHPSETKANQLTAAPAVSSPGPPVINPTLPQLKARTEEFIWEMIRDIRFARFWQADIKRVVDQQLLRKYLGLAEDNEHSLREIVQAAVQKVAGLAKTFDPVWDDDRDRYALGAITFRVKGGKDWRDLVEEAWKRSEQPTPRSLTRPAYALISWLKETQFPAEWIKETTLSWKAGLRGKKDVVSELLREFQHKVGRNFQFESRGHKWNEVLEFRIWMEGEFSLDGPLPRPLPPACLNPVVDVDFDHSTKSDFDFWRDYIHRDLLKIHPLGKDAVILIWIENTNELLRVFPKFSAGTFQPGNEIAEFWDQVSLHPEIVLEYDFDDDSFAWFLQVRPKKSWDSTLRALDELQKEPTLQEKFGLSPEAAKLFEWIKGLRADQFDGQWTPIIEDAREKQIGIKCPRDEANFPAYLQRIVDEINEKTSYDIGLLPWHDYSQLKTRLRIARKYSQRKQLIRQIQLYGLQSGKVAEASAAGRLLDELFGSVEGHSHDD